MVGNDGTTTSERSIVIDATPAAGAFAIRNLSGATTEQDDTNTLLNFHGDLA